MKYEELSLSELMGKEVVEIIPQTEGKGTVSQRNTVKKGSKITIEAYPEEGYQFVRWEDEKGNPVSEQEKYTLVQKKAPLLRLYLNRKKKKSISLILKRQSGMQKNRCKMKNIRM